MSLEEKVMSLLHEKIGFNPESIGSEKVLASVRQSLSRKRIGDEEAFLTELRSGNDAFYEIVNAVVVPETWFFRDGAPFEYLKRHVMMHCSPPPAGVVRCLSVPCSTGEEPYSIAMALLDIGLNPQQFTIDAIDISSLSLERAAAGHYGQNSFRGQELGFRDRYFERHGSGYKLKAKVRQTVRFARANLLDEAFSHSRMPYDVVFCRNLLIYFDQTGWAQATQTLEKVLKDSGVLFMGHSELLNLRSPLFESIRVPQTFAYRKATRKPAEPVASRSGLNKAAKRAQKKTDPAVPPKRRKTRLVTQKTSAPAPDAPPAEKQLDQASQLADQGEFERAAEICRRCLAENPASARSYLLLGLIAEAGGKASDAEDQYRRALYLDSQNDEAMVHLALLLEARGDRPGAETLRKRAGNARRKA